MLRAVIFDFNGILVNDEPIHWELFRRVLLEEGLALSDKEYYERYLGMDDRGCFRAVFQDRGRSLNDAALAKLIKRKAEYYRASIADRMVVFPGVKELVPELAARFPLAVASGALRDEIELVLQSFGLRNLFRAIASAEDVAEGKPDPGIFLKALQTLNDESGESGPGKELIRPSECLVIEDSKEGILAAHRAGMKCLAVANSYPAHDLASANAVADSLKDVTVALLESLFK
ncbi:MAG TPA: HAD family phosphatase [Candidatus Binatia bacterium]|jgi:HAD superfamily hydrolase (TIGR01509 family)